MRIEQAEERKEIDIAISEVVKEGGSLNILPSVKNYFSIDYKPKNNKLSLIAGGYIGLIPINEKLAIEIKPKFSISNLTRIVSVAEDNFNTLSFFNKKYREAEDFSSVVFEFMAECLANELRTLEQEGLLKQYIQKVDLTNKVRGRIDLNASIQKSWSHGLFNKVAIQYFDLTPDNPFNRHIKHALRFCIDELNAIGSTKKRQIDEFIEFYALFDAVSSEYSRHDFEVVCGAIEADKLSTLRSYYVNVCEICRLIADRRGISFNERGEDLELNSFTLDMAVTFEKYLLNSVRKNREFFSDATAILDGNNEGRKKFYNQPSIGTGDVKPDIIFKEGENCRVVADVKYKTSKNNPADRYQVISHALSYGAKTALLIFPRSEKYQGDALVKLGNVGNSFTIDVYEYHFDLESDDLVHEEKKLAENISALYCRRLKKPENKAAVK